MNTVQPQGEAGKKLKAFIDRIDQLEGQKENIAEDIREVYTEVKSSGFCAKTLRKVIKIMRMNPELRRQEQELMDIYLHAVGAAIGITE